MPSIAHLCAACLRASRLAGAAAKHLALGSGIGEARNALALDHHRAQRASSSIGVLGTWKMGCCTEARDMYLLID